MGPTNADLNKALNEVFLSGRFESRPLYLVLDNQGRERLSSILGIEPNEVEDRCCAIVGSKLSRTGDPYAELEIDLWSWVLSGRQSPPPFTSLLFALSHAAELMASNGNFSATNYYIRLSALVGIPAQKLSQHGRSTEQFWKAFNSWLADNDFAYGRPTARAINEYKYVGIAMSQAIVREVDRQRFHLMFEKYGFSNTDYVSTSEIDQYISTWIHSSQPTKQLKEAWKKTELRPRICEAAASEFEEWQTLKGVASRESGAGLARLSLALSIRHDLFARSVALHFGKEQALDRLALALVGGGEIELSNTTFAGFATLEPRSAIPLERSLLHGLELELGGKTAFKWAGRPAIPFARSDQGYWSEVSRVSLGTEHLVLVRDDGTVRRAIEAALEEAAAPGYTVATPDKLKGLPSGWVMYEKVVVVRALGELKGFESVLSPVGDASSLRLEGGIKLGRGIFHRQRAPLVYLDAEKPGVAITVWEGTSPDGSELLSRTGQGSSVALDLSACVPESGNIFIEGKIGRGTVASASLLFRSADRPRPLNWQENTVVSYTGITSTSVESAAHAQSVRGLSTPEYPPCEFDLSILASYSVLEDLAPDSGRAHGAQEEHSNPSSPKAAIPSIKGLSPQEVMALPCAVRGLHRLHYAMVPPGAPKYAPVDVNCRDCDITYLHRRSPPATSARSNRRSRPVVPSSPGSAPDTAEAVKFPFADFPKVETTAKAGEYVIVPSYNWIKDAAEKGVDSTMFIWYVQKMAQPDKENSEVQFMQERKKVPNAYVVAIPPGQKAKNGDVILTWWQTGSGMNRAIVVDDKDPIAPIVRYLDIDYDNPAKSRDNVTTIGKMDEKIVPDSFFKIKEWDAGTTVAIQDGANLKKGQVIRVAGDKVLVLQSVGKLKVYPKSACKPVPVVPNVKDGDRVKVPFVGTFKDATVSKVDAKIGRELGALKLVKSDMKIRGKTMRVWHGLRERFETSGYSFRDTDDSSCDMQVDDDMDDPLECVVRRC